MATYSVQYEETSPGHINVEVYTADGDTIATGSVGSLEEAKTWADAQIQAYEEHYDPPPAVKGQFQVET